MTMSRIRRANYSQRRSCLLHRNQILALGWSFCPVKWALPAWHSSKLKYSWSKTKSHGLWGTPKRMVATIGSKKTIVLISSNRYSWFRPAHSETSPVLMCEIWKYNMTWKSSTTWFQTMLNCRCRLMETIYCLHPKIASTLELSALDICIMLRCPRFFLVQFLNNDSYIFEKETIVGFSVTFFGLYHAYRVNVWVLAKTGLSEE